MQKWLNCVNEVISEKHFIVGKSLPKAKAASAYLVKKKKKKWNSLSYLSYANGI